MMESSTRSVFGTGWTREDAANTYHFDAWGKGYFGINDLGHAVVRPNAARGGSLDLFQIVEELRRDGLRTPLLLRFAGILEHRLSALHGAFARAIAENDYQGDYIAVYPIKVNQQRAVVEEVYHYGARYGFGLEVGSKPELLAVLAMADDPARSSKPSANGSTADANHVANGQPNSRPSGQRLIVCNGFKDDDYIRTVTVAAKLGRDIIPVVEKMDELSLVLDHAARLGVRPRLGVRVKLASQGAGRWRDSSGARSKFGLFISEVVEVVERLEAEGLLDCLELVHCHPGSQLHDVRRIKDAVGELAHVYTELHRMGAKGLRYLDVGGGLGVDYDGSQTNHPSSTNYAPQVSTIK